MYRLPHRLALLSALVLCALPAVVTAQIQTSAAGAPNLRFVGVTTEATPPAEWFAPEDLALLLTLREPMSPNEMLRARMAFRFDQLQRLQRTGFLVQEGERFRSTLMVLDEARLSAVREMLRSASVAIVSDVRPQLSQLNSALTLAGHRMGFPAILNWLLRERVWATALRDGRIDLAALTASQQLAAPNRGWYGVLWIAEQAPLQQAFTEYTRDKRTMFTSWVPREGITEPFSADSVRRFLGDLENEDREVDNPDRYAQFNAAELIDDDGVLRVPAMRWDSEEPESYTAMVQALNEALLQSIMRRLPVGDLAAELHSRYAAEAATIGYVELVPLLVEELIEEGFPMALAEMPMGGMTAGANGFTVPLRDVQDLPHVSAVIIRDLEPIPNPIPIRW